MRIFHILEKSKDFYFLLGTSFLFFLFRLPSLFEPYWYGDEGIYQVLGIAIRSGRLLYRDIWDNKPPLLYLLYALFNSDQFAVKLASLIFGLLAVFVFFILCKKLFNNQKPVYLATSFFALLFAIPLIEGNIANAENFMLLPIIGAGALVFSLVEKPETKKKSFLIGLILGLAFLIKIVAIFDFAAFLIFLLIVSLRQKLINFDFIFHFLIKIFPIIIGFLLPLVLTLIFFISTNALSDFLNSVFLQMFGYVGHGNKLIIPQGFLILKLILLFGFTIFVFLKRNSFEKPIIFIIIWFAFSVFNALFSQRPYPHYLLVLLPGFSLFFGLFFWNKKYSALLFDKQKIILMLGFLLSLFFVYITFSLYSKTILYYQNFLLFIINRRSLFEYQLFFDRQTPTDYQLAQFIKTHTTNKDNLFIWGNNAQIYKMVNKLPPVRYAVSYHMTSSKNSLEETGFTLKKLAPRLIVIMPNQQPIPYKLIDYSLKYKIDNILIYEKNF